jgi:2-C-methyl-D-erythritol 4-phosphate cytidylyltransferase
VIGVVVTAAGSSTRMASGTSKVLLLLGGTTVLERALAAVRAGLPDALIVVTTRPEDLDRVRALAGGAQVVMGGATRQASVTRGVEALPATVTHVLVHDAARPLATADLFRRTLEAVRRTGAAVTALPPVDTLHRLGSPDAPRLAGTVDRRELVAAQTPQGARADWLREVLARAEAQGDEGTDEAGLLCEAGYPVATVAGEASNLKLTRPEDLPLFEALLAATRPTPP